MNQLFGLVPVKLMTAGAWRSFICGRLTFPENHRNAFRRNRNQSLPSFSLPLIKLRGGVISVRKMVANMLLSELNGGNCIGESGCAISAQQAQQSQFLSRNCKFFDAKQSLTMSACYRLIRGAWPSKGQTRTAHGQVIRERFKTRGKAGCDDVCSESFCLLSGSLILRGDPQRRPSSGKSSQCGNRVPVNGPFHILFVLFCSNANMWRRTFTSILDLSETLTLANFTHVREIARVA